MPCHLTMQGMPSSRAVEYITVVAVVGGISYILGYSAWGVAVLCFIAGGWLQHQGLNQQTFTVVGAIPSSNRLLAGGNTWGLCTSRNSSAAVQHSKLAAAAGAWLKCAPRTSSANPPVHCVAAGASTQTVGQALRHKPCCNSNIIAAPPTLRNTGLPRCLGSLMPHTVVAVQ